jgi:hypothetical protein
LTDAYLAQKKDNPDMGWLEWYNATQGNTKQLEKKFDPTTSDTDFVNDSVAKFDSSLESGDFSDIDDNEWFAILEADASAISKLKDSSGSKSVTDAEINGDEILRVKDFHNLGLRADSEIDGNIQEGNSPDVGVGEGNGSIIVLNGRPARVVEFFSSSKSSFTGGVGARQGNMWVVYLDEDPATREKYNVGGSADFVEV